MRYETFIAEENRNVMETALEKDLGFTQKNKIDTSIVVNPETSLIEPLKSPLFIDLYNIFSTIDWLILENLSPQEFITSDNPMIWHDFVITEKTCEFIPYGHGMLTPSLEVIFPLTKKLIAIGNRRESKKKFSWGSLNGISFAEELNRYLVIAAEEFVFSSQDHLSELIRNHKDVVPRVKFIKIPHENGILTGIYTGLGDRHRLPKWN